MIKTGLHFTTDKTSPALTSYDLFKAFAVLLMIVDHLGYYFFPDELWLRVIGRFCVPVWFFLVGYARSRDLSPPIWIGVLILVLAGMVAGQPVFPLNVLATMIVIRLTIDPVMRVMTHNRSVFWGTALIILIMALPSYHWTEYGTQGLLLALFGYIIRHRPVIAGFSGQDSLSHAYYLFVVIGFVLLQQMVFGFDTTQFLVMGMGIFAISLVLTGFRPMEFPEMTTRLPTPMVAILKLLGRRTLEIYVFHLVLFKILATFMSPERFPFLQWTWFWA